MSQFEGKDLAKYIQHTNVNPDLTKADIIALCDDCIKYGFDGVMLQPAWVATAKEYLKGTEIKVCTALGYPMGADQLDFMANIGYLKGGDYDAYRDEIAQVVKAANGKVVKIMLEFGMLTEDEKVKAAELAIEAGITYLKNSSGWGRGGKATVEDIKLLKKVANGRVLVKASGGIRTKEDAIKLLEAGACMLGTSAGVAIVTGGENLSTSNY